MYKSIILFFGTIRLLNKLKIKKSNMQKSILFISTLLMLAGCSEQKQEAPREAPALPVEVVSVFHKNIPIWLQYTGKTEASSSQEVRARVSGILEEVYYADGEDVKKGQKLFKIEQDKYIAALDAAKANKTRNLATLKLAQADVNRYKPLVDEGLAPRATLEAYEAQVATSKADISSDDASIKKAELERSYTIIKAPIDGQASRRLVDIGNLVGKNESTVLTTIKNTNPLYAYFAPSEEDFQKISRFRKQDIMDAYIEIDYQSKALKTERIFGKVNFSDNKVDPTTSTVSMRAEIPNDKNLIFPGTFVYVNVFVTDQFNLMGVPPQVLFEDQRGKYLYVLDDKSTAQRVYVKTIYDSRFFVLLEKDSLKDGDKIIINALMRLKPGVKVAPTDMTETKGLAAVLKENNLIPSMPAEKE